MAPRPVSSGAGNGRPFEFGGAMNPTSYRHVAAVPALRRTPRQSAEARSRDLPVRKPAVPARSRSSVTGYGAAVASAQPSIGSSPGFPGENCVPSRDRKKLRKRGGVPAAEGHLPLGQDLDGQVLFSIPISFGRVSLYGSNRNLLLTPKKWQVGKWQVASGRTSPVRVQRPQLRSLGAPLPSSGIACPTAARHQDWGSGNKTPAPAIE